jgi:hypothetical protein
MERLYVDGKLDAVLQCARETALMFPIVWLPAVYVDLVSAPRLVVPPCPEQAARPSTGSAI